MRHISKYLIGIFLLLIFFSSCTRRKIDQHKEWKVFFKDNEVDGSIMIHDYLDGTFDVYNLPIAQKRYLPAQTFQIMNALVGLETAVILDTNMVIKSDTLSDTVPSNMTMAQAFRTSNVPYFQWVAETVGPMKMRYWIDSTYYGNKVVSQDMKNFWLDNSLQISPDEQMGLTEQLYLGKLSFQSRTQRLVKALMIKQETHNDTLAYQTGVGHTAKTKIGWVLGWLKKKDRPYFFVLRTEAPDSIANLKDRDMNILFKALKARKLLQDSEIKP